MDHDYEALAAKARTGNPAAVNALLEAIRPLVLSRCRKFLPNALDAEEAAQDTLLLVSRNIENFEGRSKFTTWLYPICTNASIDCYRKLKRRRSIATGDDYEVAAGGSTPSVMAGAKVAMLEVAEQLDRSVVELVLMRDLLDMDYADIALARDANESTIRWQVAEGRKKMKRLLSPLA